MINLLFKIFEDTILSLQLITDYCIVFIVICKGGMIIQRYIAGWAGFEFFFRKNT